MKSRDEYQGLIDEILPHIKDLNVKKDKAELVIVAQLIMQSQILLDIREILMEESRVVVLRNALQQALDKGSSVMEREFQEKIREVLDD